ncbi:MAG: glycoside hydrolase family 3 C-terminal domain-containing protein [Bacteroidales bacterium]
MPWCLQAMPVRRVAMLWQVLYGDYNPAGRLPVTWYRSVDQLPPFEEYSMKGEPTGILKGHPFTRLVTASSYTTFSYEQLAAILR